MQSRMCSKKPSKECPTKKVLKKVQNKVLKKAVWLKKGLEKNYFFSKKTLKKVFLVRKVLINGNAQKNIFIGNIYFFCRTSQIKRKKTLNEIQCFRRIVLSLVVSYQCETLAKAPDSQTNPGGASSAWHSFS